MKRVLLSLILGVFLLSAARTFYSAEQAQWAALTGAPQTIGQPFSIPYSQEFSDPAKTSAALARAAEAADANIFRTVVGYTPQNRPITIHYVLLVRPTHLTSRLPLAAGRFLTPAETVSGSAFLATQTGPENGRVGTIRDFGGRDLVEVRPLAAAYQSVPTDGLYVCELPEGLTREGFLNHLATAFSQEYGQPVAPATFAADTSPVTAPVSPNGGIATASYWALLVAVVLLGAYHQLREAKRGAVLRLNGFGPGAVWYSLIGRAIVATFLVALLLTGVAVAFVPDTGIPFTLDVAQGQLIAALTLSAVTLVSTYYLNRVPLSSALKNRRDTRTLFLANTTLKGAFSVALVITGAGLWGQYQQARGIESSLREWRTAAGYGVFYPSSVGYDLAEIQAGRPGPTAAEATDLYRYLNERDALYVDASAFTDEALSQPLPAGSFRFLTVNPNYLRAFPMLDDHGNQVAVAETQRSQVILVPAALKAQESAIRASFLAIHRGAFEASLHEFGRQGEPPPADRLDIIWLKDGQDVFSFSPLVAQTTRNMIRGPIIKVITAANSAPIERANAVNGGIDAPLKARLTDNDPGKTLAALEPELKRLHLDDNLRHLVTLADYRGMELARIQQGIRDIATLGAFVLLTLGALALQNVELLFERHSRRIAVRKLHGFGFLSRQREFLAILYVMWGLQLTVGLLANAAGMSFFSTTSAPLRAPTLVVVGVAAIGSGLELLVGSLRLLRIETRRLPTVLKEEF